MASSFRNQDFGTAQKMVQQWLKHPVVWSGLASIGVHGVLFALLPFLNANALNENPPDIQRSVDLVELTPEEQQRLPDFPDQAPVQLPPLSQNPAQNPPDLFSNLPPLPGGSVPNQTIPPIDSPFFNPLPIPSFPIFPTVPPVTRFPLNNPPPVTPPRTEAARPNPSTTPPTQAARPQQPTTPPTETGNQPEANNQNNQPENTAPTQENQPAAPTPSQAERIADLRQSLAFNAEGTTQEASTATTNTWLQAITADLGSDRTEEIQQQIFDSDNWIDLSVKYPRAACPRRPNDVVIGVLVDAEGKIVESSLSPVLARSSGYGIFNQMAVDAVRGNPFEAKGKTLPYFVRVTFQPLTEVCPAGTLPPQPPAS